MPIKLNKKSTKAGFTIVELLIVIVIIGILAAITIVSYTGITNKANETTIISDLANAKKKIALYYAEHNVYPSYLDNTTKCLKNESGVADTNYCLKPTTGNSFTYTPGSITAPTSYELTSTRGSINYKITNDLPPTIANLPIGQPLANWSWSQIAQVSAAGTASTYFQIGNTKDITLSTNEVLTMQIYDFNHDDKSDGTGKAGITFGTRDLMTISSLGSTYALGQTRIDLFNNLPNDLRTAIKDVKKYTANSFFDPNIRTTIDKVFFLSQVELTGAFIYSYTGEGVQYPIFNSDASRIKRLSNGSGVANRYWGRSPSRDSSNLYISINNQGVSLGLANDDVNIGMMFAFSV